MAPDAATKFPPGSTAYRRQQRADLLRFAAGALHPHGFGYLGERGELVPDRGVELWITCRMTHVFSLAVLADEEPAEGGPDRARLAELARHGVAALLAGPLRDVEHDGWFGAVDEGGVPTSTAKEAYGHAFVLLAASSAVMAGVEGADALLAQAISVHEERFWDEAAGKVVEEWDRTWSTLEAYRGLNSTMHTVEAYLAVGDALDDLSWHQRAGRMCRWAVDLQREHDGRLPEHFDSQWRPLLDYNKDEPAHPFRPYGATVGHALEWSRLCYGVWVSLGLDGPQGMLGMSMLGPLDAVRDGWAVDGATGFIYTTDWSGAPVVRTRMHWVLAEAIALLSVLEQGRADGTWADQLRTLWAYADHYVVDHEHGSWRHELDERNRPSSTTWSGKPDVYHAYQAALAADVPPAASFAGALRARGVTR